MTPSMGKMQRTTDEVKRSVRKDWRDARKDHGERAGYYFVMDLAKKQRLNDRGDEWVDKRLRLVEKKVNISALITSAASTIIAAIMVAERAGLL